MGSNFDPWEFFVWLMDLTEKQLPFDEGQQLINERMAAYSYAERVIIDKFRKKYLLAEPGEDGMIHITLIDRHQHLAAKRDDYIQAARTRPS